MKKRIEKPKAKPVASKSNTAQKTLPRKAAEASLASSHDSLRSMLKGVHTQRVCR
jgi:hypothetical protein